MSRVFISYARSSQGYARKVAEALRGDGLEVWLDDQLPAHRAYADVIEEQLRHAEAVVVIWSADAAKSHWVRSEAELARQGGKLVQVTIDRARLPMPFDQIQCADLSDWTGGADAPAWRQVTSSIEALTTAAPRREDGPRPAASASSPEDDLHRAATQRADAEIGFRKHLIRYAAVNAVLAAINLVLSPRDLWFQWPLFGWGLGLAAHGLSVYLKTHDGREAAIARNLRQMRRQDPPSPR